jgi:5-methylcytosine-specific restriction enzyme subunit McrC
MSAVFEAFVRNFFRIEQSAFDVSAATVPRNIASVDPAHMHYIPEMRTDVLLRSTDRAIVIDAKFYKNVLMTNRWGGRKLRSEHLYQILSYMRHCVEQDRVETEGILLYAATGQHLDLAYDISGQRLRVHTLQLDRPWHAIRDGLLSLVGQRRPSNGSRVVEHPGGLVAVPVQAPM